MQKKIYKIGLISCVNKKQNKKTFAKDLYISDLFKKSLNYCKKYNKIFILSAKYGLLELDDIIKPYNLTLNKFTIKEKKIWAIKVFKQLEKKITINDIIYWHCGKNYKYFLSQLLKNKQVDELKNLSIGKRLQFYKKNLCY